jgi:hypothetical protein
MHHTLQMKHSKFDVLNGMWLFPYIHCWFILLLLYPYQCAHDENDDQSSCFNGLIGGWLNNLMGLTGEKHCFFFL